jgi:hypothetical protein
MFQKGGEFAVACLIPLALASKPFARDIAAYF